MEFRLFSRIHDVGEESNGQFPRFDSIDPVCTIRETENTVYYCARAQTRHLTDVPRRRVSKRRKNVRTYIYRTINQTRQGSPRIEHYLAHVETPVSDFVRLVRSLARFVLVAPP